MKIMKCLRARGGAVGRDAVIQAGRPRAQFPICSSGFFIDLILTLGSTQLLTEMITGEYFLGGGGRSGQCVGLATLPPSCAKCLLNLRAPTSCPDTYKNNLTPSCACLLKQCKASVVIQKAKIRRKVTTNSTHWDMECSFVVVVHKMLFKL